LQPVDTFSKVKLIINGTWIGIAKDPLNLYKLLKEYKLGGIINVYTSIVFDYSEKEINICNSAGRLTRPVLRIGKDNKLLLTPDILEKIETEKLSWSDLLNKTKLEDPIIEYLDPLEQNSSVIAMKWNEENASVRYTHCEIHPSTLFGVLASCIPFPEHNQAPRNTYQCAMGKQAMGMYVTNYDKRMDKTAFVLNYSSKPLVDTRIMNMLGLNVVPSGSQVIVAIMSHSGYNQEDSVLLNKGAIDRGLFQATIYHTEKDEDKKLNGTQEIRTKPNKKDTKGMKLGNYDKINAQGVVDENTILRNRDIFIAKVLPIKEARNDVTTSIKFHDESRIFKTDEEVYVDKNIIDRNGDGYTFCKTRLRSTRKPVIGDKFSSRHGQKGTVGNIIAEEDMPFCSNGLKPDIIINPHAIPSRMTIAQLKETLLGKVLLELGMFGDGTSFTDLSVKSISSKLLEVGYEAHGNEIMYNGETGEQISSSIFIGPCFYQRLKHMVIDKVHSRSIGPSANLTRQPLEGRKNGGGLRFGEMERDCMISHGAARFTIDRLMHCSDGFTVTVCKPCGMIVPFNEDKNINICKTCNNRVDFATIDIPYAYKLLTQELITMNIAPRFVTS
jgi:DNA-directed RNA polymerase II subunit RPB2